VSNRYILVVGSVILAIGVLWSGVSSRQQVASVTAEAESDISVPDKSEAASPASPTTPAVARQTLSTQSPSGRYNTLPKHDHSHDHSHDIEIPVEIQAYIERQRIPANQLIPTQTESGVPYLDAKGQFEVVSIAVIGDDGKVKITERQIQPRPDIERN